MRKHRSGYTLVEVMVAVGIASFVTLAIVRFVTTMRPYFQRMKVRQEVFMQGRVCVDTILQALRAGKAGTLVISTPAGPPLVPNSKASFSLMSPLVSGTTSYSIYLSTKGVVYLEEFRPPNVSAKRILASNVRGLLFAGDSRDPMLVSVTLRIEAPWDASGDPTRVTTLLLENQTVQMQQAQ